MVLDAVSNFVRGNTDAAVGTSDTTVSVVDASIFPDPPTDGEFNVVIWDVANFPRPDQDADVEIVRVTGRDTGAGELTVVRGQETTSAAAHPEGSAIHLSPTAKMFSDIEDTFTTEAEAADAAPVQSVFGRVGTVVAETGDYAATQISNFSSEVLTSISGSTIAPSDITNLWNGTVVTADVNNTNTTTEALEAETATIKSNYGEAFIDSTFTITNQSTFTQVPIDSTGVDLAGAWDTANDVFVAPASGQYIFSFSPRINPSSSVSGRLILDISGQGRLDKQNVSISNREDYSFITGAVLTEGETQRFEIFQTLEDGLSIDPSTGTFQYWRIG